MLLRGNDSDTIVRVSRCTHVTQLSIAAVLVMKVVFLAEKYDPTGRWNFNRNVEPLKDRRAWLCVPEYNKL